MACPSSQVQPSYHVPRIGLQLPRPLHVSLLMLITHISNNDNSNKDIMGD